jgi:predicted metal-dependent HD superfamily phosphohydrolase
MNIHEDIQWIQNELEKVTDPDLIETFKQLLLSSHHQQAEQESIERGLKDFEEGKIYSHHTAKKIYEKYL